MHYSIDPKPNIRVARVGPEDVPIVVLDDIATDGGARLCAEALTAGFKNEDKYMYPGIRAPLSAEYVLEVLQPVYRQLYSIYGIPNNKVLRPTQACYSLITLPERELTPMQCIPHFDTCDPYFFAVLHYLAPGEHGDTGLFMHQPTGFCRVHPDREESYFRSMQHYFDLHGPPRRSYITEDDGQFRLYYRIPYKANRLVIYPGNMLHSTIVNKDKDIDPSPVSGRLTANVFVRYE